MEAWEVVSLIYPTESEHFWVARWPVAGVDFHGRYGVAVDVEVMGTMKAVAGAKVVLVVLVTEGRRWFW